MQQKIYIILQLAQLILSYRCCTKKHRLCLKKTTHHNPKMAENANEREKHMRGRTVEFAQRDRHTMLLKQSVPRAYGLGQRTPFRKNHSGFWYQSAASGLQWPDIMASTQVHVRMRVAAPHAEIHVVLDSFHVADSFINFNRSLYKKLFVKKLLRGNCLEKDNAIITRITRCLSARAPQKNLLFIIPEFNNRCNYL